MSDLFRIALGQMTVAETGTENLAKAVSLMKRAADAGARLLVLPEGVIARKPTDGAWSRKHAEPLDGPFVSGLLAATADIPIAVSCTVHEPSGAPDGRVWNTHIVADGGKLLAAYRKLHLYDAFSGLESVNVVPGDTVPPLVDIDGWKFGLETCYDVRFPELSKRLALDGGRLHARAAARRAAKHHEHNHQNNRHDKGNGAAGHATRPIISWLVRTARLLRTLRWHAAPTTAPAQQTADNHAVQETASSEAA